ncbi:MAG: hypothetical protein H6746_19990 [Deltaproteobacteria bacterium]|nr:hypothetical protein [Deltaproteobacteria bacterium]
MSATTPAEARDALDRHVRDIVGWHLDPQTGTPLWQALAAREGIAAADIRGFDDLARFPRFELDWLKSVPHAELTPRALAGRPFSVFETGGTTGLPAQRLSWDDHLTDYDRFSETLPDDAFPRGAAWLMLGPTGPRRLRLAIEHLANIRGGPCYHVDLDARWVKALLRQNRPQEAQAYKLHVVEQAVRILRSREVACLFTTPKLLEALGEVLSPPAHGVRGVFLGGTSMTAQTVRFLVEEVLESRALLVPTYGNTLMGLARSAPLRAEDGYRLTYYAPQPRAVLRVVDPDAPDREVPYDAWGQVELTTLTRECFIPRLLERDEAIRRAPQPPWPWDGTGEVRPLRSLADAVVEGVY